MGFLAGVRTIGDWLKIVVRYQQLGIYEYETYSISIFNLWVSRQFNMLYINDYVGIGSIKMISYRQYVQQI